MIHKQLFITGIRLFGVWEMLRLIDYLVEAYDMKFGFYKTSLMTIEAAYSHVLIYLVVGLYLLAGAPHVVNFFCSPVPVDSTNSKQASPDA